MSGMLLSDFARTLAMRLPQSPCRCRDENVQSEHYTFSTENLPDIPALLVTSELVMRKTEHQYGSNSRIDTVHFYASGQTHRDLAVWQASSPENRREPLLIWNMRAPQLSDWKSTIAVPTKAPAGATAKSQRDSLIILKFPSGFRGTNIWTKRTCPCLTLISEKVAPTTR
jgi:hypothetical protein